MSEEVKELQAMIIHLTKRIEKLEGKKRMAPATSYFKELKKEAAKIASKIS